ncbi:hypothetical protein ACQP1G_16590 [Nocardia sp. CA-107356]|uniref:WXG100 family type VII secretion target n=1 Tax=Nocardia sp. CA-107356 TaxID=3239972 RepID=UPI003D8D6762
MSSITALWEWIPPEILQALNFGQAYPKGDEDDLFKLGDAWKQAAAELAEIEPDLKAVTDATQNAYTGEGADAAAREFATLFDNGPNSIQKLVDGLTELGHTTRNAATILEYTKIWEAVVAGITAYTVCSLIASWPWGEAAVPLALAAGREAVTVASEQGAEQLALQAGKAGLRNLLKPYLKQIGIAGLKAGRFGIGMDVGIQAYQLAAGHRDDGYDLGQTLETGFEFGAGAIVATPVGMGLGNLLGRTALPKLANGIISHTIGGAIGGFGTYGAGIAWQVGDQLVHGHLDWNKVDTTFDPRLITMGAAMGALGGLHAPHPENPRNTPNTSNTTTSSKPGKVTPESDAKGRRIHRRFQLDINPDRATVLDQSESERKRASEYYAETNKLRAEAAKNGGYSDTNAVELEKLHGMWLRGESIPQQTDGTIPHPNTTPHPNTDTGSTTTESRAGTPDTSTKTTPTPQTTTPAPDNNTRTPTPPERTTGPATPPDAPTGTADKVTPRAHINTATDNKPNIAAAQQHTPATTTTGGESKPATTVSTQPTTPPTPTPIAPPQTPATSPQSTPSPDTIPSNPPDNKNPTPPHDSDSQPSPVRMWTDARSDLTTPQKEVWDQLAAADCAVNTLTYILPTTSSTTNPAGHTGWSGTEFETAAGARLHAYPDHAAIAARLSELDDDAIAAVVVEYDGHPTPYGIGAHAYPANIDNDGHLTIHDPVTKTTQNYQPDSHPELRAIYAILYDPDRNPVEPTNAAHNPQQRLLTRIGQTRPTPKDTSPSPPRPDNPNTRPDGREDVNRVDETPGQSSGDTHPQNVQDPWLPVEDKPYYANPNYNDPIAEREYARDHPVSPEARDIRARNQSEYPELARLTDAEIDLIRRNQDYALNENVNNATRNGDEALLARHDVEIRALTNAYNKLPDHDGVVFRSLRIDDPVKRREFLGYYDPNQPDPVVVDSGFASSDKETSMAGGNIELIIESRHGKDISWASLNQDEVVFPPGHRFQVESRSFEPGRRPHDEGKYIIRLIDLGRSHNAHESGGIGAGGAGDSRSHVAPVPEHPRISGVDSADGRSQSRTGSEGSATGYRGSDQDLARLGRGGDQADRPETRPNAPVAPPVDMPKADDTPLVHVGEHLDRLWRAGAQPHEILDSLLNALPELRTHYKEICTAQGYTLHEHTQMMLHQWRQLVAEETDSERLVPQHTMLTTLLLHDLGKETAQRQYQSGAGHAAQAEHRRAVAAIERYGDLFGSESQVRAAISLIDADPIGYYLRNFHSADTVFQYVAKTALELSGSYPVRPTELTDADVMAIRRLFRETYQYFLADFSSYTSHSRYMPTDGGPVRDGQPIFNQYLRVDAEGNLIRAQDGSFAFTDHRQYAQRIAVLSEMFSTADRIIEEYNRIGAPRLTTAGLESSPQNPQPDGSTPYRIIGAQADHAPSATTSGPFRIRQIVDYTDEPATEVAIVVHLTMHLDQVPDYWQRRTMAATWSAADLLGSSNPRLPGGDPVRVTIKFTNNPDEADLHVVVGSDTDTNRHSWPAGSSAQTVARYLRLHLGLDETNSAGGPLDETDTETLSNRIAAPNHELSAAQQDRPGEETPIQTAAKSVSSHENPSPPHTDSPRTRDPGHDRPRCEIHHTLGEDLRAVTVVTINVHLTPDEGVNGGLTQQVEVATRPATATVFTEDQLSSGNKLRVEIRFVTDSTEAHLQAEPATLDPQIRNHFRQLLRDSAAALALSPEQVQYLSNKIPEDRSDAQFAQYHNIVSTLSDDTTTHHDSEATDQADPPERHTEAKPQPSDRAKNAPPATEQHPSSGRPNGVATADASNNRASSEKAPTTGDNEPQLTPRDPNPTTVISVTDARLETVMPDYAERLRRAPIYRKKAVVQAVEAEGGENVVTILSSGKEETRNTAKRGDWIITNPGRERYIVAKDKFSTLYEPLPNGKFAARGTVRAEPNPTGKSIVAKASWGETRGDSDCYIASGYDPTNPEKISVRIIGKIEFEATYSPIEPPSGGETPTPPDRDAEVNNSTPPNHIPERHTDTKPDQSAPNAQTFPPARNPDSPRPRETPRSPAGIPPRNPETLAGTPWGRPASPAEMPGGGEYPQAPDHVTAHQIESVYGIPQENQQKIQGYAERYNLVIDVRPTNPDSVPHLRNGAIPKPVAIKDKTVNDSDIELGARAYAKGLVGRFEPGMLEMPVLDGHSDAHWKRLQSRLDQRNKDYEAYKAHMDVLHDQGRFQVRDDGVVEGRVGNAYKPVTGDHDLFDIRHADGSLLTPAELAEHERQLIRLDAGIQHGPHVYWEPATNYERARIFEPIFADHQFDPDLNTRHEPLVQFRSHEDPVLVWADKSAEGVDREMALWHVVAAVDRGVAARLNNVGNQANEYFATTKPDADRAERRQYQDGLRHQIESDAAKLRDRAYELAGRGDFDPAVHRAWLDANTKLPMVVQTNSPEHELAVLRQHAEAGGSLEQIQRAVREQLTGILETLEPPATQVIDAINENGIIQMTWPEYCHNDPDAVAIDQLEAKCWPPFMTNPPAR